LIGNNLANFGPLFDTALTVNGNCPCLQYFVSEAIVTENSAALPVASGASPALDPFASVIMTPLSADTYTLVITWTGGTPDYVGQCIAYYNVAAGPSVLGVPEYFFTYWWAVMIGCIVFFLIFCGFCIFFGVCKKICTRPSIKQWVVVERNSRIPVAQPQTPIAGDYQDNGYAGNYEIPTATAVVIEEDDPRSKQIAHV